MATLHTLFPKELHPPIGKPMGGALLYVVAQGTFELQPIGVAGELLIGGVLVATGYVGRDKLTREKFVPDAIAALSGGSGRVYRTGDLVRWLPEGELEFLGRIDGQVKIRGHRIELGEIEAALLAAGFDAAAVVDVNVGEGDKKLAAYVVGAGPTVLDQGSTDPQAAWRRTAATTRRLLAEHLAEYMLPASYIRLEALPLTSNQKVDRAKLPKPIWDDLADVGSEEAIGPNELPSSVTEELLQVRLWSWSRGGRTADTRWIGCMGGRSVACAGALCARAAGWGDGRVSSELPRTHQRRCHTAATLLRQAEFCELLGVDAARVGVRSSFFALGGHSIAAARLAARCAVLFNVQLPLPMVFAHPRLGELAAVLDSLGGEGGVNPEEKESAAIEADARTLPDEVRCGADAEGLTAPCAWDASHTVLLTGATGFLGAFLLYELLEQSDARVCCIVRAKNQDQALARLVDCVSNQGAFHEAITDESRVKVVLGESVTYAPHVTHVTYVSRSSSVRPSPLTPTHSLSAAPCLGRVLLPTSCTGFSTWFRVSGAVRDAFSAVDVLHPHPPKTAAASTLLPPPHP